jgi:8-oxo-dGTP diphosphatase
MSLPQCCYRVSVKALIIDTNGKILLVQETDTKWGLLGGGVDHGEDIVLALTR